MAERQRDGSEADVCARRSDVTEAARGFENCVNATTAGNEGTPALDTDAVANVVLVRQDGGGRIKGRR